MGTGRFLRRSVAGSVGLLAISASSAVNETARQVAASPAVATPPAWLRQAEAWLQAVLSPVQAGPADPVSMALLGLACMAIVVKRRGNT
jgi:hypothetical protein